MVLEEYLISVGAKVDENSLQKLNQILSASNKILDTLGTALKTVLIGWLGKTIVSLNEAAEAYERMAVEQKKATYEIMASEEALKAMGKTLQEVKKDANLKEEYDKLVKIGEELRLPKASVGIQNLRGVLEVFNEIKYVGQYALQWINENLMKRIAYPLGIIRKDMQKIADLMKKDMPKWTDTIAKYLATIAKVLTTAAQIVFDIAETIYKLPDGVKKIGAVIAAVFSISNLGTAGKWIAALSTLILLIEDYMVWMRGGKSALPGIWEKFGEFDLEEIQEKIGKIFEPFDSLWQEVVNLFSVEEGTDSIFEGAGRKIGELIKKGIYTGLDVAKGFLSWILGITDENGDLLDVDDVTWGQIGDKIAEKVPELLGKVSTALKGFIIDVFELKDGNENPLESEEAEWGEVLGGAILGAWEIAKGVLETSKIAIIDLFSLTDADGNKLDDAASWGQVAGSIVRGLKGALIKGNSFAKDILISIFGMKDENGDILDGDTTTWGTIAGKIIDGIKIGLNAVGDVAKDILISIFDIRDLDSGELFDAQNATWKDVASGVIKALGNAFDTLSYNAKDILISLFDLKDSETQELLDADETTWGTIAEKIIGKLREGFESALGAGKSILISLFNVFADEGDQLSDEASWGDVGKAIFNAILNGIREVSTGAQGLLSSILGIGGEDGSPASWEEIGREIADKIKQGFNGGVDILGQIFMGDEWDPENMNILDIVKSIIQSINKAVSDDGGIVKVLLGVAQDVITFAASFIGDILSSVADFLKDENNLEAIKGIITVTTDAITNFVNALVPALTSILGDGEVIEAIGSLFFAVFEAAIAVLESLLDSDVFEVVLTKAIELVTKIADLLRKLFEDQGFLDAFNSILDLIFSKILPKLISIFTDSGLIEAVANLGKILAGAILAFLFGNASPEVKNYFGYSEKTGTFSGLSGFEGAGVEGHSSSLEAQTEDGYVFTRSDVNPLNGLVQADLVTSKENPFFFASYGDPTDSDSTEIRGNSLLGLLLASGEFGEYDPNGFNGAVFNEIKRRFGLTDAQFDMLLQMSNGATEWGANANAAAPGSLPEYMESVGALASTENIVMAMLGKGYDNGEGFKSVSDLFGGYQAAKLLQMVDFIYGRSGATYTPYYSSRYNKETGEEIEIPATVIITKIDDSEVRGYQLVTEDGAKQKEAYGGRFDTATSGIFGEDGTEYIIPITKLGRAKELILQMFSEMGSGANSILADLGIMDAGFGSGIGAPGLSAEMQPAGMFGGSSSSSVKANSDNNVSAPTTINVYGSSDPYATGNAVLRANESNVIRKLRGCFEG